MSQAVQLAKAAREKLASALNALQTEAEVPEGLMDVAEPIAQAMGVLHRVERSNGTDLEGRDKALEAVRRALDLLQKIDVSHAAVDACLEAVAASLSKVHGLTKVVPEGAAATPAPAAVAPAAPPAPQPAAIVPPATPFPPVAQLAHQQIPRPVAASYPPQPAPAAQPAPRPAPAPAPVAAWPPAVAIAPTAPAPVVATAPPAGSQGPSGTQVMGGAPAGGADARMQGGTLMMQKSPVDAALAAQAIGVPPIGSAPTAPAPVAAPAYPPAPVAFPPVAPAPMVAATSPFPSHQAPSHQAPSPQPQATPQAFAPPVAPPVQAFQPQPVAAFAPTPEAAPAPVAAPARSPGPAPAGSVVVELGAHSASNFYKGLSGNDVIEAGGIFVGTYKVPKLGTQVSLRVLLPGDYEFHATGVVQWVRESGDGVEPGFGAKFTQITPEGRQLVYRYARNREPLFYDDL